MSCSVSTIKCKSEKAVKKAVKKLRKRVADPLKKGITKGGDRFIKE